VTGVQTCALPISNTPTSQPSPQPTPTPQPTFTEPEEFTAESMVGDMMGMNENSSFSETQQSDGMPQFGDPSILAKLDELSKTNKVDEVIDITPSEDAPKKRKRGRPKKKK